MADQAYVAQKRLEERARVQQKKNKAAAEAERARVLQKQKDEAAEAERARAAQEEKDEAAKAKIARETAAYIQEKIREKARADVTSSSPEERQKDVQQEGPRAGASSSRQGPAVREEKQRDGAATFKARATIRKKENEAKVEKLKTDAIPEEPQPPPIRRKQEYKAKVDAIPKKKHVGTPLGSTVLVKDLSPYLKVYKNGRVHRLAGTARVFPSEKKAENGILSKDVRISPNVSARVYCPKDVLKSSPPKKLPILVYYHGGGFCCEAAVTSKTHSYVIQLASKANAVVVSVDYRVAPEIPLPAAFEDACEALTWVASHASEQTSVDPSRVQQFTGYAKAGYSYIHSMAQTKIAGAAPAPQSVRVGPVISWLVDHGDFSRLFVSGDGAGGTIAHYVSLQAIVPLADTGKNKNHPADGVKILGTVLCFPYFLENTTAKESIAYRLWTYLYHEGVDSVYINPFGPRYHPFQFQKMFICYGDQTDDRRNVGQNFVKAMKDVEKWQGEVTVAEVKGKGHSFQVENPTSEDAKELINQIASFVKG